MMFLELDTEKTYPSYVSPIHRELRHKRCMGLDTIHAQGRDVKAHLVKDHFRDYGLDAAWIYCPSGARAAQWSGGLFDPG